MSSCLGIYIEDNLIKYAKISKSNETIKVESFGVKFYETVGTAINQIIEDTYSFKTPISINTNDEWYNKIQVFSLLSKSDMKDAINTEFEHICYEKEINKNIYEQRYILANSYNRDDKIEVIHISVPKTLIEQRKNQFLEQKINTIIPLGTSIADLISKEKKGTSLIVNIEKHTTITKVVNGTVADIRELNYGANAILEKINKKENSYSKAYDICKSSTIYTESDRDLQYEDNDYLEDIMPTLFEIVSEVKNDINQSIENIEKVYITGTGAVINNIDIYFQDYLKNVQCEILRPSFISNNSKINIKDYIEVNSAIALALQGLEKNNELNFKNETSVKKAISFINTNFSDLKQLEATKSIESFFGRFNRPINFMSIMFLLITTLYFSGSAILDYSYESKISQVNDSIEKTNKKIEQLNQTNEIFTSQITELENLISNIEKLNNSNSEDKRFRNSIPNLLNNIMAVIPKGVQLVSIQNTSGTHIVIKARSDEFQQIAYFKTKLDVEQILKNVVSNTGTSSEGYLNVTIEGELP